MLMATRARLVVAEPSPVLRVFRFNAGASRESEVCAGSVCVVVVAEAVPGPGLFRLIRVRLWAAQEFCIERLSELEPFLGHRHYSGRVYRASLTEASIGNASLDVTLVVRSQAADFTAWRVVFFGSRRPHKTLDDLQLSLTAYFTRVGLRVLR